MRHLFVGVMCLSVASAAWAESGYNYQVMPDRKTASSVVIDGKTWGIQSSKNSYSLMLADGAQKFQLRDGNQRTNEVGTDKFRTELSEGAGSSVTENGQPFWLSYSINVTKPEAPWLPDSQAVIGQLHARNDLAYAVHPQFAFRISDKNTLLATVAGSSNTSVVPKSKVIYSGALPYNRWVNIVARIVPDPVHGSAKAWIDGKLAFDYQGAVGYVDDRPYWKYGIYRSRVEPTRTTVQYANMRLSTSDLSAKITAPDPIGPRTNPVASSVNTPSVSPVASPSPAPAVATVPAVVPMVAASAKPKPVPIAMIVTTPR